MMFCPLPVYVVTQYGQSVCTRSGWMEGRREGKVVAMTLGGRVAYAVTSEGRRCVRGGVDGYGRCLRGDVERASVVYAVTSKGRVSCTRCCRGAMETGKLFPQSVV
ncbi:hypothetical protein chiPu_0029147 [Chiloscyllium punctatum]|uniref:Uncharacterized protein n=1 Tax=Chiloscyllium punctatum TaxID=137246 RepID=A0A401TQ88_CHIPU|nr:hypothetical protein [Chiloscyllium punctatum]